MEIKVCKKCGAPKPLSSFQSHNNGKRVGLRPRCNSCMNLQAKIYRDKDRPKWRKVNREDWKKLRREVLLAYGSKCVCCGETIYEFLALDHVNGGGCKHRAKVGTRGVYADAKQRGYPPDYEIRCHNCNQAKAWYGKCPHANNNQTKKPEQLIFGAHY